MPPRPPAATRKGSAPASRKRAHPKAAERKSTRWPQAEIAALLGITDRQVRNYSFPRHADGYDPAECVKLFVAAKVAEVKARVAARAAPASLAEANERFAVANAELLELKLARERGAVVDLAAYEQELHDVAAAWRGRIDGILPGESAPDFLHITDPAVARDRLVGLKMALLDALAEALAPLGQPEATTSP